MNDEDLARHVKCRLTPFSGSGVVQEVMQLSAGPARRLLKELVGETIETPNQHIIVRLVAARLLSKEFNFRRDQMMANVEPGESFNAKMAKGLEPGTLMPFNLEDYREAVEYANSQAALYAGLEGDAEGGDDDASKRGRKGGTFDKVQEYMLDNPDTFEKSNKADDLAKTIAEILDVPETTTLQYIYKCRRLRKQGEI
jgi:hypothetical protein